MAHTTIESIDLKLAYDPTCKRSNISDTRHAPLIAAACANENLLSFRTRYNSHYHCEWIPAVTRERRMMLKERRLQVEKSWPADMDTCSVVMQYMHDGTVSNIYF